MSARRITAILLGAVLVVAVLLVVAQLVLPSIAEQRLRDDLAGVGRPTKVEVEAFPAIELLWGQADRVTVRMARYSSSPGRLGDLLERSANADRVDATAASAEVGPLRLRGAAMAKRGQSVSSSATLTEADLVAALPPGVQARPIVAGDGRLLLRGSFGALGLSVGGRAALTASEGALVLAPEGIPFGDLAQLTLFKRDRITVTGVGARPAAGGFRVFATGQVRDG